MKRRHLKVLMHLCSKNFLCAATLSSEAKAFLKLSVSTGLILMYIFPFLKLSVPTGLILMYIFQIHAKINVCSRRASASSSHNIQVSYQDNEYEDFQNAVPLPISHCPTELLQNLLFLKETLILQPFYRS